MNGHTLAGSQSLLNTSARRYKIAPNIIISPKIFFQRIPFWLKFAIIFVVLYWMIDYIHDLLFIGHDDYISLVLVMFVVPVAFLVYDLSPWIRLIAYFLYLLVLGSVLGFIIQLIKSKIRKK